MQFVLISLHDDSFLLRKCFGPVPLSSGACVPSPFPSSSLPSCPLSSRVLLDREGVGGNLLCYFHEVRPACCSRVSRFSGCGVRAFFGGGRASPPQLSKEFRCPVEPASVYLALRRRVPERPWPPPAGFVRSVQLLLGPGEMRFVYPVGGEPCGCQK